jgi:predicted phosphodiesterase
VKIAVLSDIHGNLPALEAVAADVDEFGGDAVFVNGDIVNRGPRSLDAWRLVCDRRDRAGWRLLAGNHEDYVVRSHHELSRGVAVADIHRMSVFSAAQLGAEVAALSTLPDGGSVWVAPGVELRLRHASMRGNTDGIDPAGDPAVLREQIAPPPACFVTGHTHRGYELQVGETLLVNAGAVGAPADGDPRASYVRVTYRAGAFEVETRRVPYDRAQAERDYRDPAWLAGAGPLAALLYVEWLQARPLLATWMDRHAPAVREGRVDLRRSIADAVAAAGGDPALVDDADVGRA